MTLNHNTDHPNAQLSAMPSDGWKAAWDAYRKWAHGGEAPPGIDGGAGFSTVVMNSTFSFAGEYINMKLPPGSTYPDIQGFIDDAINYANKQSPGG
jgi:hypothetical protein